MTIPGKSSDQAFIKGNHAVLLHHRLHNWVKCTGAAGAAGYNSERGPVNATYFGTCQNRKLQYKSALSIPSKALREALCPTFVWDEVVSLRIYDLYRNTGFNTLKQEAKGKRVVLR